MLKNDGAQERQLQHSNFNGLGCVGRNYVVTPKENPDALEGAIGVKVTEEATKLPVNSSAISRAAAIAFGEAVANLPADQRLHALEVAFEELRAGAPIPAFAGVMAEARLWASWASRTELKAYGAAIIEKMHPADLAAFLGFAAEVAA